MAKAAKKTARKKAAAKPKTAKKAAAKAAPKPAPAKKAPDPQQMEYAKGVEQFNARHFGKAAAHFRKALEGDDAALRHRAEVHLRICEKQTASDPKPKQPEDLYTYAVALINERDLDGADKQLDAALKRDKSAGHLHYAKAVVAALRGEASAAYERLKQAVEIDPQNRILARKDADLGGVKDDERIRALLDDDEADEA